MRHWEEKNWKQSIDTSFGKKKEDEGGEMKRKEEERRRKEAEREGRKKEGGKKERRRKRKMEQQLEGKVESREALLFFKTREVRPGRMAHACNHSTLEG